MYITKTEYVDLYGTIQDTVFNRLSWEASRYIEYQTTGVDGYSKLKNAFPTDEDDAYAIKMCVGKLINTLQKIEDAETSATNADGFITRADGTVSPKMVSSVSSGSESMSFSSGNSASSRISMAAKDKTVRNEILYDVVYNGLVNTKDANGIHLLYMGVYPRVQR